jgi:alpha-L-fucosidase
MSENFDRDLQIDTPTSGLFLALLFLLINSVCFAQKKSAAYVLPPMPVKETRQMGFIADPASFPE